MATTHSQTTFHRFIELSSLSHEQNGPWSDIIRITDIRVIVQNEDIVTLDAYRLESLPFLDDVELIAATILQSRGIGDDGEGEEDGDLKDEQDGR